MREPGRDVVRSSGSASCRASWASSSGMRRRATERAALALVLLMQCGEDHRNQGQSHKWNLLRDMQNPCVDGPINDSLWVHQLTLACTGLPDSSKDVSVWCPEVRCICRVRQ